VDFFAEMHNREEIARLIHAGVHWEEHEGMASTATRLLADKVFVLTGTLPGLKREDAKALIEAAGGKVSGSVSKKTSYIVAGEEAGSKLDRARELGIAILDEAGLFQLLRGESS
jgi:DNA ligase (NAD+)